MDTTPLFPLQYGNGIIPCKSAEERKILQEAILVAEDSADAKSFTTDQLQRMSEICRRYNLKNLQKVTAKLAEQSAS